ncbi:MAG TPA: N-acetylneuraminate synthase family protein, partial [Polyangia bacterium]|nr:N-acetylneuraminate synthase family protein [Polyangia bacterium]
PVAYALGARVIEKHFTLNRAWKGTDHAFSLEPVGMTKMVRDLHRAREALGDGVKRAYENEIKPLNKMAKKLVAARDLPQGHVLGPDDVALKSPNDGLPPYELDRLVGRKLTRALKTDENLTFDVVSLAAEVQPAAAAAPAPPRRKVPIAPELRERVLATRSVIFDFDGVFTDGAVYVSEDGRESVRCNRSDGLGLQRLAEMGLDVLILSTETNPVVSVRAAKLKVACLHGQQKKIDALKSYAAERGLTLEQIAYVGNDINDSECLKAVGLPIVVHDAWPEVARLARLRTERPGGQGAVREICDLFFAVRSEERPA